MPADPGTGARPKPRPRRPRPIHDPPSRPDAVTPADKPKPQADPEVIRRQRLLKASGYGVTVDGVWGPVSERAWRDYTRRPPAVGDRSSEKSAITAAAAQRRRLVQAAQARARVQVQAAKVEAQTVIARRKAATINPQTKRALGAPETAFSRTALLRRKEIELEQTNLAVAQERRKAAEFAAKARKKAPEKLTHEELLAITVDPMTGGFDYSDPSDVRLVQRWLRANFDSKVVVDGTFGRQTGEAFLRAYDAALEKQERVATNAIVQGIYKPAGIKAGDTGFPVLGVAPKPGELYELLTSEATRNSFAVRMLMPKLVKLSRRPELAMLQFKEREFDKWGKAIFGAFAMPEFIANTGTQKGIDQDYMRVALNSLIELPRDNVVNDTTLLQLGALYKARKPEQFARQIRSILRKDELAFRDSMAERAKKDGGFWDYLDALSVPVEVSEQMYVSTAHAFGNVASSVRDILIAGGSGANTRTALLQSDLFQDNPEAEAAAFIKRFDENHPWMHFAVQAIIDPLNLVPVAPILKPVGWATKTGILRVEKAGLVIVESGDAVRLPNVLQPTWRAATELAGQPLILPAASFRAIGAGAAALSWKARRMRDVSVAIAKGQVRVSMRHGFEDFTPKNPDVEFVNHSFDTEFTQGLKRTRATMEAQTQRFLGPLIHYLAENRVSLWADDTRRTFSEVGGAIFGRMAEGIRVNEVQKLALEAAREAFFAFPKPSKAAHEAAKAAYRDVIERSGTYIVGHGDPELTDILNERVNRSLDRLASSVLPAVQGRVVALLDEANLAAKEAAKGTDEVFEEIALFDELGRWTGNAGELSKQLRAMGLEAFSASSRRLRIRNRHFNVSMDVGKAGSLMADELNTATRRIESYAARRAAAGRTPADVDALIAKAQRKIKAAYVPDGKGGVIDNREWLDVPDLYGRHLAEVYGPALDGTHPWLGPDDVPDDVRTILEIAAPPKVAAGGEIEAEIEKLSWALTGRRPVHANDYDFDVALRGFELPGMDEFLKALDEREAWLSVAHDAALPKALLAEGAYWQALAHAESGPMKYLYTGLNGWLQVWTTLTLPGRPGFVVRNVIDNTAKMLVYGVRDPRAYFLGAAAPGQAFRSIFESDFRAIRFMLSGAGRYQGNPAVRYWDALVDTIWDHSSSVLSRIFHTHAIPVPETLIQQAQITKLIEGSGDAWVGRFKDGIWELMAAKPENFAKRSLYRHTYHKALKEGATELEAARRGWEAVEKVLFDYSQISTLEDNLRFIFPFAQYWRRTAAFWGTQAVTKPWLPAELARFEETLQEDAHGDWPEWMRRYVDATDLLAGNPAFAWLKPFIGDTQTLTDPLNVFSFAPFYRAFKQENQDLPPDKAGMRFISDIIDAINDWGLSFNPIVRKPLEIAGVANFRAWQSIFPQNSLIEAFTREFMAEQFPNGINLEAMLEDEILDLVGSDFSVQEKIADNFDLLVNKEMAAQQMRGEKPSRAKAEEKIRGWLYAQTAIGFFSGIYPRAMDPATFHLYELIDGMHKGTVEFDSLSQDEKNAYQLFKRRGLDPVAFDRYVKTVPLIEAYYALGDWEKAEQFKIDNPEIVPHVDPVWTGKSIYSSNAVRDTQLVVRTTEAFRLYDLLDDIGIDGPLRDLAESVLVTKELRAFWAANDTAEEQRKKHLQGLYWEFIDKLNATFHAIPDKDYAAKQSFLDAHPILGHHWQQSNSDADDFKDILNAVNADLREEYFRLVKEGGWDAANSFLKQFPFMFEFTKAADRVSPDGEWVGGGSGGKGRSQHARDYMAAKSALDYYFSLAKDKRGAWLRGGSREAQIVRQYFDKYGSGGRRGRGQTQHSKDYLAAKSALDHYFSLSKEERGSWLHAKSRDAMVVLAYFKKYGTQNKYARNWTKFVVSANPEINARLQFWKRYWTATPEQRPALIAAQAENAGIFVWGPLGQRERDAKQAAYLRGAMKQGMTKKAASYLRIKPLLDFYFTLKSKDDKRLFLKVNPDVEAYFDLFSEQKLSGDKKLDGLIEGYFKLPEDSEARSDFLHAHPEVQRYFNKKATPAERAIHRVIDVYFRLQGDEQKKFRMMHPEIDSYFDRRREEQLAERAVLNEFDINDPRLRQHFADAEEEIVAPGERMRAYLKMRSDLASNRDLIDVRRERTPEG